MKKFNKNIIIAFICLMIFPLIVHADMGAPYIAPYELVVIKEEGINLNDYNNDTLTTIPYNTVLEVLYVYEKDNIKEYYVQYGDDYGYVNSDDVALKDEVFNPEVRWIKIKNFINTFLLMEHTFITAHQQSFQKHQKNKSLLEQF